MKKTFDYILPNKNLITNTNLNFAACGANVGEQKQVLNLNLNQEIDFGLVNENVVSKNKCKLLSVTGANCIFVTNGTTIKRINYDGSFSESENFGTREVEGYYSSLQSNIGDLCLIENSGNGNYRIGFSIYGCIHNALNVEAYYPSSLLNCPDKEKEYIPYTQYQKYLSNSLMIFDKTRAPRNQEAALNPSGVQTIQIDFGILPEKIAYDYTRKKIFSTNIYSPNTFYHKFKDDIRPIMQAWIPKANVGLMAASGMISCTDLKPQRRLDGQMIDVIYPTTYIDGVGPRPMGLYYDEDKDYVLACHFGGGIDVIDPQTNEIVEQITNLICKDGDEIKAGLVDIIGYDNNICVLLQDPGSGPSNIPNPLKISKLIILTKDDGQLNYYIKRTIEVSDGAVELKKYNNKIYVTCYTAINIIDINDLNKPVQVINLGTYQPDPLGKIFTHIGRSLCVLKDKLFVSVTAFEEITQFSPWGYGDEAYYKSIKIMGVNEVHRQKVLIYDLPIESSSSQSYSSSSKSKSSRSYSSLSSSENYFNPLPPTLPSYNSSSTWTSSSSSRSSSSLFIINPSASTTFQRKNTFNNFHIKNMFKRFAFTFGGMYEENSFNILKRSVRDILNYLPCISSSSSSFTGGGGGSSAVCSDDFDTLAGYKIEAIYVHSPLIDSSTILCGRDSSSSLSDSSNSSS